MRAMREAVEVIAKVMVETARYVAVLNGDGNGNGDSGGGRGDHGSVSGGEGG